MSSSNFEHILGAVLKACQGEREGKGGNHPAASSNYPRRWSGRATAEAREAERKVKSLENQVHQLKGAGRQREDRIKVNSPSFMVQALDNNARTTPTDPPKNQGFIAFCASKMGWETSPLRIPVGTGVEKRLADGRRFSPLLGNFSCAQPSLESKPPAGVSPEPCHPLDFSQCLRPRQAP